MNFLISLKLQQAFQASLPWDMPHGRYVHYKVSALEEIVKKYLLCNIIGRRHQEIYPKLEEKVGRKYPVPKVGRKFEKNIRSKLRRHAKFVYLYSFVQFSKKFT